jgi:hypothetical protein
MTPVEPDPAGLDPIHILAICTQSVGADTGAQAVATSNGVRVSLPTRRAAWTCTSALGQAGYTATPTGDGRGNRGLVVTGWNADRLDARLTAMRGVMYRLADNPLVTATAAVRRFAALPRGAATPAAAAEILGETSQQLQGWVVTTTGICLAAPPARLPADTGMAMRVRGVATCEQVISDLIERHLRVAGHALTLFGSLRQRMDDGRAQKAAVRRAGITFHLSTGSIGQDSSTFMRREVPGPGQQPDPQPRSRGEPRLGSSREFPAPPGAFGPPGASPITGRAGLGGQGFPAARPGRHR